MSQYYETSEILGGDLAKSGFTSGRAYKVYTAMLSQSGTDAPVAVVLENTIGPIVWSRFSEGTYDGMLEGAFPENKVVILTGSSGILFTIGRNSDDGVYLFTDAMPTATRSDNVLYEQFIQILVYP